MQQVMQKHAAVFRIEKLLEDGCNKIDQIYTQLPHVRIKDRGTTWNTDLIETLELENLLLNAKLKLLKGKRRKPVSAQSYFPVRLRFGRCVWPVSSLVGSAGRAQ